MSKRYAWMKKWSFVGILILTVALLVLAIRLPQIFRSRAAGESEFYVSPSGNDANNGSISAPFKTIERARQAVRTVNQSMGSRVFVYLRGGVYTLNQPLEFYPEDSGFNGGYVVYQPYNGEKVVISGGKQITGWVQDGDKWKAPVTGGLNTRQLYVNGVRAVRARSDDGAGTTIVCGNYDPSQSATCTHFQTTNPTLQNYRNKGDIELVSNNYWRHFRCPVQNIVGSTVTLKEPCFSLAKSQFPAIKNPDYFENAYELLNVPGEWYLDKPTQTIYYKPRPGEDMNTAYVVAPVLEKLIIGHGTPDNPLRFISFDGLRFEYTTWMEPSISGFVGSQAAFYWKDAVHNNVMVPTAVSFETARNMFIANNVFQHLGAGGLSFNYASQDNMILVNRLTDLSGDGIVLGDFHPDQNTANLPESRKTIRNQIQNNYIHDIAREYVGSVGIEVLYAANTYIGHNELAHLPYTGIALNTFPATYSETLNRNNLINNNLVYDHMKVLDDGAGIYINSNQPGSQIAENVVHTQWHRPGNIYLDDGATGWSVLGNIIYDIRTPSPDARTLLAKGCNHTVQNNFWQVPLPQDIVFSAVNAQGQPCQNNVGNNTQITDVSQAPQQIVSNAGIEGQYLRVKSFDLSPVLEAPSSFTLNPLTTFCEGTSSRIRLNWTAPQSNPPRPGIDSGYFVYIDGVYTYNALHVLTFDDPAAKVPGQTYRYKIEAVVIPYGRTFSNEQTVVAQNCNPTATPTLAPVPGDVDGNRTVNLLDYVLLFQSYQKPTSDPLYDARADFNHDNKVNMLDYVVLFENFGS